MRTALFSAEQFDRMADEVVQVLAEIGYLVEHPQVRADALAAGCRESSVGRILFERPQIAALRGRLLAQYAPTRGGPEPSLVRPARALRSGFGNLTSKVYDYAAATPCSGTTARLEDLVRFAHAEARIAALTIPLSRYDAPPALEQLESLLLMARLTDKPLGGVDATVPESVPYLAEMGEALGQAAVDFVGRCNCVNPPLRLEQRTAETMRQRRRYHCMSMITSMPALGGNGPVDIYGGIVLATAEIVGGLILSTIIDPEAPLMGYIASVQLDLRSANPTSSTPQTVRFDAGVYQLMEHAFGGGTRVGGRSYISARRPGLQAVVERVLKAVGYSALVDGHALSFAGNGNLDNGSMVSPEQCLLDLDLTEGLTALWTAPTFPAPGDAVARIREAVLHDAGSFLLAEHTLTHYRDELWDSTYFPTLVETHTERDVLEHCHADYRRRLASYTPASYPTAVLRELERILEKARAALR